MKKAAILLSLVVLFTVSCVKSELESQISNVSWTPCTQGMQSTQSVLKSNRLSNKVDVEFTDEGVQITHYNFAVSCDFTTVNVTHTFVNGVLSITQQGFPNQAKCICSTDVSYTINRISKNEVNVIFINGEQVYCYNDTESTENLLVGKWVASNHRFRGDSVIVFTKDFYVRQYLDYLFANQVTPERHLPPFATYSLSDDSITFSIHYYYPSAKTFDETFKYILNGNSLTIKGFSNPFSLTKEGRGDVLFTKIDDNQLIDWTNKTEKLRIHNKYKISITEGIWGTLVKTEGDCMPVAIDEDDDVYENSCKQYPVKREIVIYEYTKMNETRHEFAKFFEIYTKLVATATCDEEGFFEFALKPGKYSVFVREREYLYANEFDGQGGIAPITVESFNVSENFLNLDYAVY